MRAPSHVPSPSQRDQKQMPGLRRVIEKGTEQQSATSMALASPQLELFALITPPASPCQQNTSDPNSLGEKRLPGQPAPFWRGSFCCCCHDVRARGSRSGRRRPLSPTSHLTHLIPPDVLQCRVMTVYPSSHPPPLILSSASSSSPLIPPTPSHPPPLSILRQQ